VFPTFRITEQHAFRAATRPHRCGRVCDEGPGSQSGKPPAKVSRR
jgi:hypothetical protein